jgi:integrase
MATKVTLRQKPISGSRQSLYLDFYPPITHPGTGKSTRREFLGMYLYDKAKSPVDKKHNKETLELAEHIKAKRQLEIQRGQYGFLSDAKQKADFVDYFKALAKKRSGSNSDNWSSALNYIEDFTGGNLQFANLNEQFCEEFKEYLLTTPSKRSKEAKLSQNSAVSYFNKFKAALKQAYKDGYLETDLNARIEAIKQAETERQFLTMEELNMLANTECSMPLLKRASLFSALTGLRFSDIEKLLWSEVQQSEQEYFIRFRQKKTKGAEVLPITPQAFNLLGDRTEPDDKIFDGLVYSAYMNAHLMKWVAKAGINKDITFHCFRHTFATLHLNSGTDIYTVSKLLGHRELKTTQVYAKIIDQTKRAAVNRIKLDIK